MKGDKNVTTLVKRPSNDDEANIYTALVGRIMIAAAMSEILILFVKKYAISAVIISRTMIEMYEASAPEGINIERSGKKNRISIVIKLITAAIIWFSVRELIYMQTASKAAPSRKNAKIDE